MAPRTVKLGEQYGSPGPYGEPSRQGRRIIGIELRISPDVNGQFQQEEVFMAGLDTELPPTDPTARGHSWSVTLHTTNGDVTMDTRLGQPNANIRQ